MSKKEQQRRLQSLFSRLNQAIEDEDYEFVAESATQILKNLPNDFDAFHSKVIALIRDDEHAKAVKLCRQKKHAAKLRYELAYSLYRAGELQEALKVAKTLPEGEESSLQLRAQILYKMDDFDACLASFDKIDMKQVDEEDVGRIQTNRVASIVSAHRSFASVGIDTVVPKSDSEFDELPYEFTFNVACMYVDNEQYDRALFCLNKAAEIGRRFIEEMAAEDEETVSQSEIQSELAPITVLRGYVHHVRGDTQAAQKCYHEILNLQESNQEPNSVASNNTLCLRHSLDPTTKIFDSLKRSQRLLASERFEKLTAAQQEAVLINRALLFMYGKQHVKCMEQVEALSKRFPSSPLPMLISGGLLYREKKYQRCVDELKKLGTEHESADDDLYRNSVLALAHIALLKDNVSEAISILTALKIKIGHYPALVATLCALYDNSGDVDAAMKVLDEGIAFWRNYKGDLGKARSAEMLDLLVCQAAKFKLDRKHYDEAAALFTEAAQRHPKDVTIVSNSVIARSYADPSIADALAAKLLKDLPGVSARNVDSLETQSGPQATASSRVYAKSRKHMRAQAAASSDEKQKGQEGGRTDEEMAAIRRRKREKRKRQQERSGKRYPKGFDPEKPGPPPDPERWLPKWQRSTNKRRKKKNASFRGAQGGESNVDYQVHALPEGHNAPEEKSAPAPPKKPRKKRKKKGRK